MYNAILVHAKVRKLSTVTVFFPLPPLGVFSCQHSPQNRPDLTLMEGADVYTPTPLMPSGYVLIHQQLTLKHQLCTVIYFFIEQQHYQCLNTDPSTPTGPSSAIVTFVLATHMAIFVISFLL